MPRLLRPFNGKTLRVYVAVLAALLTALAANSVITLVDEAPRITIGDHNRGDVIIRDLETGGPCPAGWPRSAGTTPEGQAMIACDDPEGHVILTLYPKDGKVIGGSALDLRTGKYLSWKEIQELLSK